MKTILSIFLLFTMTFFLNAPVAQAFVLKCQEGDEDTDQNYHLLVYGRTRIQCSGKKDPSIQFKSQEIEIGPGLRGSVWGAIWRGDIKLPNLQNMKITCPFMREKKLRSMQSGEKLKIGGTALEVDLLLIGGKMGVGVGDPGICFIVGNSIGEFGASASLIGLTLEKI